MAFVGLNLRKVGFIGLRFLSSGAAKPPAPPAVAPAANKTSTTATPVGPGASKDGVYKNPEYYTYNVMSFYDIEKDMKSFRIAQPSSLKK